MSATLSWDSEKDGFSTLPLRVARLEWRRLDDGNAEYRNPRTGAWVKYAPAAVPILEGLEAGRDLASIVAATHARMPEMKESHVRGIVRSIVYGMSSSGVVEIDLPPVPDVFAERYERVKELGRGGVGVAWLCRDRETGERVVVKHAWNFLNSFARCEASMRREADVMRALDHPAFVRALADFEHEGRYHLVREFIDGEELGPIADAAERRRVLLAIADALAHVHAKGLLFLDTKPGNFMIEPSGRVRVADVGLAKPVDAEGAVRLGAASGSRGFAAPEVAHEMRAVAASDVYGLGRLHAFLLTGKRPKQHLPAADLARKLRDAGAPEAEVAAVARLAADAIADRPATMAEARRVIEALP